MQNEQDELMDDVDAGDSVGRLIEGLSYANERLEAQTNKIENAIENDERIRPWQKKCHQATVLLAKIASFILIAYYIGDYFYRTNVDDDTDLGGKFLLGLLFYVAVPVVGASLFGCIASYLSLGFNSCVRLGAAKESDDEEIPLNDNIEEGYGSISQQQEHLFHNRSGG